MTMINWLEIVYLYVLFQKNVEILFLLVLLNDKKYKQEVEELFLILGTQYDNEPFGNKCVLLDGIGGLVVSMLIYRMFRKNSS